ncbi:MAG: hypothetical protein KUG79_03250 [Pseudomonadales bacterium]|nr:hypothetical protein [Pseudomonadales bacterium]
MSNNNTLSVNRITAVLLSASIAIALIILCLDIFFTHQHWLSIAFRRIFIVTYEDSIGSWYSIVIALAVATVLWLTIYRLKQDFTTTDTTLRVYTALAVLMTYATVDDGAKIHERVGSAASEFWTNNTTGAASGFLSELITAFPGYPWQVVYAPIIIIGGLLVLFLVFFDGSDRLSRLLLTLALGMFVCAVGIDFLEGAPNYTDIDWMNVINKDTPFRRHYAKALEETLEMMGMACLWVAFVRKLLIRYPRWAFDFTK